MVRAVGIEPTLLTERDFESRASTNSTTPALRQAYNVTAARRNGKHKERKLCCWLHGLLSGRDRLRPRSANIDCRSVDVVLQMPPVIFLDHLDTGAAVLGNLINIRAFEQSKTDIGMPQTVTGTDMSIAVEFEIQFVKDGVH